MANSARKTDSILSLMKGQNASKNYTEKTDSILSCFYTQNLPPKTTTDRARTTEPFSQAIPQFQHVSAVLLAPPSDPFGIYEVWGSTASLSAPPLDPFGITGYGAYRGRWKHYTDLSSRDWRNAPKRQTGFELDRCPQHLCDSTVAPPLPFPVHALWICGRKWGGENGPAEHCIKGALRVTRSSPKILGDLK